MQGVTYTLGIELMLAGDIVVAADDCRFSQLEPLRGIHAAGGASIRFVQRGGWGNAMYHLLTSDVFDAEEAIDRKSTRLNSSHDETSYAVFCLKKKKRSICGRPIT